MKVIIKYGVLFSVAIMSYLLSLFGKKNYRFPEAETDIEKIYLKAAPVVSLFMAAYMIFFIEEMALLQIWKYMIIFSLLWMIAFVDYKCQLILNEYILMGIGIRGLLWIIEVVLSPQNSFYEILAEIIGSFCLLMFGVILRFLSRKGFGMGDIKLLALLPFFLGTLYAFRVVLYSMVIIFIQACFCLVTNRKGRKDILPFAPAVLGGTVVLFLVISL